MRINLCKWILILMSVFNNTLCWVSSSSSCDEFLFVWSILSIIMILSLLIDIHAQYIWWTKENIYYRMMNFYDTSSDNLTLTKLSGSLKKYFIMILMLLLWKVSLDNLRSLWFFSVLSFYWEFCQFLEIGLVFWISNFVWCRLYKYLECSQYFWWFWNEKL